MRRTDYDSNGFGFKGFILDYINVFSVVGNRVYWRYTVLLDEKPNTLFQNILELYPNHRNHYTFQPADMLCRYCKHQGQSEIKSYSIIYDADMAVMVIRAVYDCIKNW